MRFFIVYFACISGFGVVDSSTLELHPTKDTATSSIYLAPVVADPRPPRNSPVIKGLFYCAPLEAAIVWKLLSPKLPLPTLKGLKADQEPPEEHPLPAIDQEWYPVADPQPSKTLLLVSSVVATVVLALLVIIIRRFTSSKPLAKSNTVTAHSKLVKLVPVANDLEAGVELHPPEVISTECYRHRHMWAVVTEAFDPEVERPKPSQTQIAFDRMLQSNLELPLQTASIASSDSMLQSDSKEPVETAGIGASVDGSAMELEPCPIFKMTSRCDVPRHEHFMLHSKTEEKCSRQSTQRSADDSTDTELNGMQTPGVLPLRKMQRGITPTSKWLMQQNELDQYSHVLMGSESDNEFFDDDADDDEIRSNNYDSKMVGA